MPPQVKELAETKYNYTFGKGEVVSTFVAAFYDAVLLYALALNDTLRQANDPRGRLDGAAVIRNMWNRTFQGWFCIFTHFSELDVGCRLFSPSTFGSLFLFCIHTIRMVEFNAAPRSKICYG